MIEPTQQMRYEALQIVEHELGIKYGMAGYDSAIDNVAVGIAVATERICKAARETAEVDRKASDRDRVSGFALMHTFADFLDGTGEPWFMRPKD